MPVVHAARDSANGGFSLGEFDGRAFLDLGSREREAEGAPQSLGGIQASLPMAYRSLEIGLGVAAFQSLVRQPAPAGQRLERPWRFGLDQAYLRLPGTIGAWSTAVQAGLFTWTGNPDAALLGGYLARNGAYPGGVERRSEAWDSLGSLETRVVGMRLLAGSPGGRWRHEVLVLLDSSFAEEGTDFSLAHILEGRLSRGLEVGVGWELFRFASTDPEGLTPRHARNAWVRTDSGYFLENELPPDRIPGPAEDTGYYTRSGLKLGLRAALDVRKLLGWEETPGREGRLFLEAALLGLRNQPIFYDSPLHRMVVAGGAHLPSFGLLDLFCVQAEWRPARLIWRTPYDPFWVPVETRVEVEQPDPWTFGLLLSKDMFSWLALQGQILKLPDPGRIFYTGSNYFSRDREFLFLLRLAARF